ncbi:MAG: hypothetical protein IJ191_03000, partial [Treponema sp.]|nr:hypothetical protein [Treponema sp.]
AASTADTAILSEQEPSFSGMDFSFDDALSGDAVSAPPLDGTSFDVPDFGTDDSFVQDALAAGDDAATESTEPLEVFDTSDIEGLDFNIPETDSQIAGTATDFELGSSSDFADDFEIPGFSDTNVVPETKGKKSVVSPSPAEPTADDDQKNTLTDEQYQQFLTNLSGYPLNVRIAVEDLIVRNEFTDDAEFEVIKKILNRAPARQVAAHLERMLDISIPVPRDFERRTAAEYEALKSSFQYQLKNKIVPVVAVCVALVLVLFGLFELSYNFIYKPIRAHNLYRHGYALIESHDYPQSEILFTEATNYDLQKRWFYRYARAYRANRQYDRAEKMYRAILYTFNYDKQAGLEYADMEVTDRANYPKAEEILRRDVLDHHVNDADGILALGDVFLAWATEQDETKFEDARLQYATLIDLYGTTDAYLARMMRYFIRTDNLREVLQLKEHFFPKKKSLGAADWTELSGYLLDKLFGQLAPAEEYLRRNIEDVKELLTNAITADPTNPVALYNMSRYYVQMNNSVAAIAALQQTIAAFDRAPSLSVRDAYRYIDTYRLLGEEYAAGNEYLKARETYTGGIAFYQSTHELSGLAGT